MASSSVGSDPPDTRAVTQHNLAWFNHHISGDPKPDLTAPPLPERAGDKAGDGTVKKEK